MEVFLYLVLEFFFFTFCKQGFPLPLNVISQIISSYIFLQGVPKKHSYKIFCTAALMGWNKIWKIWKHAWVVAQDLVGRGVRAERPAHRDDRMLHCSHPMRAAAENFIRVFFLGHPVFDCWYFQSIYFRLIISNCRKMLSWSCQFISRNVHTNAVCLSSDKLMERRLFMGTSRYLVFISTSPNGVWHATASLWQLWYNVTMSQCHNVTLSPCHDNTMS